MKNIFLLPTNEPSRLHGMFNHDELGLSKEPLNWRDSRHLYITSNDEIKEGDYYLDDLVHPRLITEPLKHSGYVTETQIIQSYQGTTSPVSTSKKIILTTDPKLISDGIQAVDEDFLKWFLKYPKYEFVEYDKNYNRGNGKYYYKIIIPTVEIYPISIDNLEERFKKDANMIVMPLSKSYLQGFIDQFGDGERAELDPKEWDALQFLEWLKLNNYEIIKKK